MLISSEELSAEDIQIKRFLFLSTLYEMSDGISDTKFPIAEVMKLVYLDYFTYAKILPYLAHENLIEVHQPGFFDQIRFRVMY